MTQVEDRVEERVAERPVREPPVRKAPPPQVPRPPKVGLPIRWIGWAAVVIAVAGVALAAWMFLPEGGDEIAPGDLFTQAREAGVEYTTPEPIAPGELFTQEREAGVASPQLPDEAPSGLVLPGLVLRGEIDVGVRWAGESGGD